jgi:enoyl-CoA hydratase/carnithine racemase
MTPLSDSAAPPLIERAGEAMTFRLDNVEDGNRIFGPMFDAMFDAMLAELKQQASAPSARVLRIRARGKVFCTGRERKGRDVATLHDKAARIIEVKRLLRTSTLITVAEVHGDALGFGFGPQIPH